jgi:hypothetical protein
MTKTATKTAVLLLPLVSSLAGLLLSLRAQATERDAHAPLVIITERGKGDAEDTAFFSSVQALAAEIGIVVTTEEVPSFRAVRDTLLAETRAKQKPFLVAWILREKSLRTIHLFDPWENQLRTRTLEVAGSSAASAEALALILRAELLAYLEEPPPPPPPAPPPPQAPPPPSPRLSLMALYAPGTFLSGEGVMHGGRFAIQYYWMPLTFGIAYRLSPAEQVSGDDTVLTIRRHAADLDLGWMSAEYRRLRWAAEAFVCGDWISRHTSSAVPPLSPTADAGSFLVSVGARGRQQLRFSSTLAVSVAWAIELPLNRPELQVVRGTRSEMVARGSAVRLGAELGIVYSPF